MATCTLRLLIVLCNWLRFAIGMEAQMAGRIFYGFMVSVDGYIAGAQGGGKRFTITE